MANEACAGALRERNITAEVAGHVQAKPWSAAKFRVPACHEELSRPSPRPLALW